MTTHRLQLHRGYFGEPKLVWVYSYIYIDGGQENKVQFFPSRRVSIEKMASLRLKAYLHTSISANELFGVNTPMGLGRFDGYFILKQYFRLAESGSKICFNSGRNYCGITNLVFMSQKSYGGDFFRVDPLQFWSSTLEW